MSREHQSIAGQMDLPRAEQNVLNALAYIAVQDGTVFNASKNRIAKLSNFSPRYVVQTYRKLEAKGLIARVENQDGGRSKRPRIKLLFGPGSPDYVKGEKDEQSSPFKPLKDEQSSPLDNKSLDNKIKKRDEPEIQLPLGVDLELWLRYEDSILEKGQVLSKAQRQAQLNALQRISAFRDPNQAILLNLQRGYTSFDITYHKNWADMQTKKGSAAPKNTRPQLAPGIQHTKPRRQERTQSEKLEQRLYKTRRVLKGQREKILDDGLPPAVARERAELLAWDAWQMVSDQDGLEPGTKAEMLEQLGVLY